MKKQMLVLLMIALNIFGCSFLKECSEEHLTDVESPDKRYVAALFVRNCGAATPYVYHVNLRTSSDRFTANLSGNIYDGEVFDINNRKVDLAWRDERTLLISCADCSADEPVNLERTWGDVSILYQPGRKAD